MTVLQPGNPQQADKLPEPDYSQYKEDVHPLLKQLYELQKANIGKEQYLAEHFGGQMDPPSMTRARLETLIEYLIPKDDPETCKSRLLFEIKWQTEGIEATLNNALEGADKMRQEMERQRIRQTLLQGVPGAPIPVPGPPPGG